jgi:hypothetical protein
MAGSKTRPGFSGGDEPPPSNPEEALSPHAARTMIGRAIHLRVPADSWPAPGVPPSPREETPAEAPEIVTNAMTEKLPARPSHSGKTKFPAFARLFGRWTTGGGFHSRSELSADDSDLPNVPREIWASRVAIFALAAFFSFLAALAALKLHRCSPSVSRPSATAAAPAAPPPVASSTAPAVLPAACSGSCRAHRNARRGWSPDHRPACHAGGQLVNAGRARRRREASHPAYTTRSDEVQQRERGLPATVWAVKSRPSAGRTPCLKL